MQFKFTRNTMPIKEIYDGFLNKRLIIDNSYQRRKVWMPQDNIRLIETILLNLVIPEIFLWPADINPENGDTITHIVDGQQRINAIIDYISGKFKLQPRYLLNEDIIEQFSNKTFVDLPVEIKKHIWMYNMSIVNIDRDCDIYDIKLMFYRLNLTDYSLNEQEKRNSLNSVFGNVSDALSKDRFWDDVKIFSAADVRRMQDVQFCSNILILAREGIVDQTTSKKTNEIYDELKENYPDSEKDITLISNTMNIIREFLNKDTSSFLSKKSQLYSMFSFIFNLIDEKIEITSEVKEKFRLFVVAYSNFKNGMELSFDDPSCAMLYDGIKRYKLASSEGINKVGNRVLRFEILKKFCVESDSSIKNSLAKLAQEFDQLPFTEEEIINEE